MLIDDDYSTNLYHEIILQESNLVRDIQICETVGEALDHLKNCRNPPDLIILDINMPIRSGWNFLVHYEKLPILQKSSKAGDSEYDEAPK